MHGGYREGSGRAKFGYYKGIYCGSTYELCWVIYNLDHNISFKRFEGYLQDGKIKYYPDFLIDTNTIVEIKGYKTEEVDRKTQLAVSNGYSISVLYKKDLEYAFEYVKKQYKISNKNKFHTLYDDHKPQFNLVCSNCNLSFYTERKPKSKISFCTRKCAGCFRFKKNKQDPEIKKKMSNPPHIIKLKEEQVIEIYLSKESYASIAKNYGVNKSLVSHIKAKRIHKKILKDM